jgi:hypothetical protein
MTPLSLVIPAYNEEDGIAAIVRCELAVRPALAPPIAHCPLEYILDD